MWWQVACWQAAKYSLHCFWWKISNERQEVLGVWDLSVPNDLWVLNSSTYFFWVEESRDSKLYKRQKWEILPHPPRIWPSHLRSGSFILTFQLFVPAAVPAEYFLSCSFAFHLFKSSSITQILLISFCLA